MRVKSATGPGEVRPRGYNIFLARLHEVQRAIVVRSRSGHTALQFFRSPYLDNHLSESKLSFHDIGPGVGARGHNLVHIQKMIFALRFSRSPYFDNHLSESIYTCTIDTL